MLLEEGLRNPWLPKRVLLAGYDETTPVESQCTVRLQPVFLLLQEPPSRKTHLNIPYRVKDCQFVGNKEKSLALAHTLVLFMETFPSFPPYTKNSSLRCASSNSSIWSRIRSGCQTVANVILRPLSQSVGCYQFLTSTITNCVQSFPISKCSCPWSSFFFLLTDPLSLLLTAETLPLYCWL